MPFDVVIPESERNKHLDEQLQLQAEAVLASAVAGYRDYDARGNLGEPDAVTVSTDAYRLESDPVARFIAEACIVDDHGSTAASELYLRWQRWAAEEETPQMTAKAFGQALERKGYASDRQSGKRIRRGLLLAEE